MSRIDVYTISKHPDSEIDYGRNWGNNALTGDAGWLQEGETIIESTWEITADRENPSTLVEASEGTGIFLNGTITGIYLEGGTPGIQYTLTNRITATNSVKGTTRIEKKAGVINCCIR